MRGPRSSEAPAAPPAFPLDPAHAAAVDAAVARYAGEPGPLLLVLHAVQAALGYVPRNAIPRVARGLNLSRAEVYGVVTFYDHFRTEPAGQYPIAICRAEACQAMGSDALTEHAKRRLGIDDHQVTADGLFSLEPVYCLGNCAATPSVMIGTDVVGRVTPERFDALLDELREAAR